MSKFPESRKMKHYSFLDFIIFLIPSILLFPGGAAADAACNASCGDLDLPFPFGFSPGCPVRLNCSSNGTALAGGFPVQSVSGDTILVSLPAACGRPTADLRRLYGEYFAPTSHNAMLLRGCRDVSKHDCFLPTTLVQTHFELLDCRAPPNDSISCYSEPDNQTAFIDYRRLEAGGCRSLFSSISMEAFANGSSVALDVQVARLGWWLRGKCRCSRNARCVAVVPPGEGNETAAYRCECLPGFAGDGFRDGLGCRKEPFCNPSRYLSGQCGGTTRVGALIGGVAAGAALMVSIGLIIVCIRRRAKLRSRSRKSRQLCETTGITIPLYPYREMDKATDGFSEKRRLGNGAYGTVYSGKLNEEWVAIKRIKHRDAGVDQVINEIKLLSSVSHHNLVRLLGCSIENDERILVYEFMPNGTLAQHLQREKGTGLPWPVRLTIASETAQAISYLHNAMQPPIYHRDIKSSNILLDYDYKSKVADFGLSRLGLVELSHISTAPQGTPGYLDPQYHQHFHLSDKSDVYSFGVVLVEIITALTVVDFSRPQNEVNLASLAVDRIGRGALDEIIDPFLEPTMDAWTFTSVHKAAELAFRCLAYHQDMRPSMMEVAVELEQIRLSKWSNDMNATTAASRSSSRSSSSNLSEKPLNASGKRLELFSSTTSLDTTTDFSPASVEDSWRSDQSSPSSNSLLSRACR